MTQAEAVAVVRTQAGESGLQVDDFHFLPHLVVAGSSDARFTPWPGEDVWVVSVVHDLICRGLIDSGGSVATVNGRTGRVFAGQLFRDLAERRIVEGGYP